MALLLRNRISVVWLVLVGATFLSWWAGTDHGFDDAETASLLVLFVAFIKVRFVGMYFMELRHAPIPLKLAFEAWALVACGVTVGLYLSGV